jgi:hypothetical protein
VGGIEVLVRRGVGPQGVRVKGIGGR